jgi:hypothetical protein
MYSKLEKKLAQSISFFVSPSTSFPGVLHQSFGTVMFYNWRTKTSALDTHSSPSLIFTETSRVSRISRAEVGLH